MADGEEYQFDFKALLSKAILKGSEPSLHPGLRTSDGVGHAIIKDLGPKAFGFKIVDRGMKRGGQGDLVFSRDPF
jgi:hypothetical protein